MSENQNRDFAKYDAMATEELEEILRSDSQSPEGQESDGELLLYVMGVLAHRKRNGDNPGKTAQQAWESFEKHYLPREEETHTAQSKRKTPLFRRWVAAAAVVAVFVAVPFTASALRWDEIWNAVATWAKETFSFVSEGQPTPTEPVIEDERSYDALQELLAETDQDSDIVPTWIPNGYMLQDIRVDETPMQKNYMAFYTCGEKELKISIRSYMAADPEKLEITEDIQEIYTVAGVEYYIISNFDQLRVVWISGSYECNISGDLTVEEMKQMIDSIGKG